MYNNRYKYWTENKEKLKNIDKKLSLKYSYFEDYYFANLKKIEIFFNLNRDQNGYSDTFDKFVKIFACDLVNESGDQSVWGKAVDICKPEPKPEPIKKLTPIEIIQKYSDRSIFPFINGEIVPNEDMTTAYYKRKGTFQGREGEFRYQAPNKEGIVIYGFYINGENIRNDVRKVQVIHESKGKKKNISERFERDLRVLHLLKEVSRINKTKKKIVFEQGTPTATTAAAAAAAPPTGQVKQGALLSDAQAKYEFDKKLAKYFNTTFDFMDVPQMENYNSQIINVLKKGYKGVIFGAFRRALYLASITIPGASGEDSADKEKTQLFKDLYAELNGISDKTLFNNPTSDELEAGTYEIIEPARLDAFLKSLYNPEFLKDYNGGVYRPTTLNTYRTKPVTEVECQTELRNLYKESSTFTQTYCNSQKYQDRKQYIFSCKSTESGKYFRKTADIVTANDNRFSQMYAKLYSGIGINAACAFKPNRK
jgi:hypothetical protein